mgnify:FL=1
MLLETLAIGITGYGQRGAVQAENTCTDTDYGWSHNLPCMDAGFLLECMDDEAGSDSLLIRYPEGVFSNDD